MCVYPRQCAVIDPRSGDNRRLSVYLDEVGEKTLSLIRNVPDTPTDDKLALVHRVVEGEEQ